MPAVATKLSTLTFTAADITSSVKSYALSKSFMQKLLRLALLNVMYRRLNLNELNFIPKKLGDVPFVLFRHGSQDPIIRTYHAWVKGMIDAIDRDYLKEVILLLRNSEDNKVLEYYKFSVKYNTENEVTQNKAEVKEVTIDLLRVLLHLGKNEPLGDKIIPDVVFTYYPNTPKDYEPPNFTRSEAPPSDLLYRYTLGSVNTGFHKLTCRAGGNIFTHWAPSSQGDEVTDEENIQNDKTVDTENATSEAADIEASGKTVERGATQESDFVERGATQESDLSKANDETVVDKGNAKEKRKPEKIVNSQQTHSNSSKANTPDDTTKNETEERRKSAEKNKAKKSLEKDDSFISEPTPVKKKKLNDSTLNFTMSDDLVRDVLETEDADHITLSSDHSDEQVCRGADYASCVCRLPLEAELIACGVCGRRYHMYCHGYLDREAYRASFFRCIKCGTTDMHMGTAEMANESTNLARLRFVIGYLSKEGVVPQSLLNLIDEDSKKYITEKLRSMKLFDRGNHLHNTVKNMFSYSDSQVFSI